MTPPPPPRTHRNKTHRSCRCRGVAAEALCNERRGGLRGGLRDSERLRRRRRRGRRSRRRGAADEPDARPRGAEFGDAGPVGDRRVERAGALLDGLELRRERVHDRRDAREHAAGPDGADVELELGVQVAAAVPPREHSPQRGQKDHVQGHHKVLVVVDPVDSADDHSRLAQEDFSLLVLF
jgi:hypothetical protein